MAGVTAQGATFSFGGFTGSVVGVSVETPTAEITDMSGVDDSASSIVLVPTGAWSGGSITVDYLRLPTSADPQSLVRSVGWLSFDSSAFAITRRVVCESASTEARAGELVRGNLRFRVTDYMGV